MDDSPGLLRRLAGAAGAGLRLLAVGLAALALAVVAAVTTVIGAAAKVVAEMLGQLAGLLQGALPWLLSLAPWLIRAAVAIAVMGAIVWSWPVLWLAYSQDVTPALAGIIATMLIAAPVMVAVMRRDWAILLASAPIVAGTAFLLARFGSGARAAVVIIPLAVMVAGSIFTKTERGNTDELSRNGEEWGHESIQEPHASGIDPGDGLHDVEFLADDDGAGWAPGGDPGADRVRGGDDLLGEVLQRHGAEQPAGGDQRLDDPG